jgi:hypothetical protein
MTPTMPSATRRIATVGNEDEGLSRVLKSVVKGTDGAQRTTGRRRATATRCRSSAGATPCRQQAPAAPAASCRPRTLAIALDAVPRTELGGCESIGEGASQSERHTARTKRDAGSRSPFDCAPPSPRQRRTGQVAVRHLPALVIPAAQLAGAVLRVAHPRDAASASPFLRANGLVNRGRRTRRYGTSPDASRQR